MARAVRGAESSTTVVPPGWDAWVQTRGPEGGFLQTSEWAAIDAALNGAEIHVVSEPDGRGGFAAGALLRRTVVPVGRRARLLGRRPTVALRADGAPVLGDGDSDALLERALARIGELADSLGAGSVSLVPAPTGTSWPPPATPAAGG
jgi:hypothetical protein